MIVIPPQDSTERPPHPAAEALGNLYGQFTNVQNLSEFHAALRKRDALYELRHQEMGENPQDFENLHPRDFYRQFDRRADEDDKTVVGEAPYPIRQQLRDALWAERETAQRRALETYKKLFIDHQLSKLETDRLYYLGKMADATNDQDRDRYLTALISRLKLSGDVGLLYRNDADRLIENIPSDLDIFSFNREFASDPARAQRLLLYGAYPNIRPELREELVGAATEAVGPPMANLAKEAVTSETPGGAASAAGDDVDAELKRSFTKGIEALQQQEVEGDSTSNNGEEAASNPAGGAGLVRVAVAPSGTTAQPGQKAQPQKPQNISQRGNYDPINKEEFASIVEDYTVIAPAYGTGSLADPKNPFKFARPVIDYAGRTITPEAMNIALANTYEEMTEPERTKQNSEIKRHANVKGAKVPIVTKITEEGVASDGLGITGSYFNRLDEIQRDDIPEYVRRKYGTVDNQIPSTIAEIILAKVTSKTGDPVIQYAPPYNPRSDSKYKQATAGSDKIKMDIYKLAVIALMATAKEGPWYDFDSFRGIAQGSPRDFRPGEINLGSGNDFMPIKPYVKQVGR